MTALHKKRLLKLAAFLREKVPDEHWNFYEISNLRGEQCEAYRRIASGKQQGCGAAACAMGWVPAVFPRTFTWDRSGLPVLRTSSEAYATNQEIETFFGLSEDDRFYLFELRGYRDYSNVTRRKVAARIESFVKRGGMPERSRA